MKLSFTTTVTTLLVLCALVMTALVAKREFFASVEIPEPLYELDEESWQLASEQRAIVGKDSVSVRIVVFHDYECSVCRRADPILDIVSRKFSGKIAVVYRHLPLPRHPLAHSAAMASECANKQGSFASYHAALYEKQGSLKNDDWGLIAQEIGIAQIDTFLDCMEDKDVGDKIESDKRLAESLGITSVPTYIVNKKLFEGLLSVAELDVIVQDLLQND